MINRNMITLYLSPFTDTMGLYCKEHSKEGMINVKAKRCAHDGCMSLNPGFDTLGESISYPE